MKDELVHRLKNRDAPRYGDGDLVSIFDIVKVKGKTRYGLAVVVKICWRNSIDKACIHLDGEEFADHEIFFPEDLIPDRVTARCSRTTSAS